ncbi:putative membrane protein YphA (DoxX/SURF4 family) [Arthrobacter sp. CAN_A214]
MAGLMLVGTALVLGVGLRVAAAGGTVLMGLIWVSALPLKQHPVVDEHVIYIAALWVLALTGAGRFWGLGRRN